MAIDVSAVGLLTAIVAGAISFISPCVLPLVPGYLSFVSSGVDPTSKRLADRIRIVWSALFFIAGFSTVFVILGLGAQAFGVGRGSSHGKRVGGHWIGRGKEFHTATIRATKRIS